MTSFDIQPCHWCRHTMRLSNQEPCHEYVNRVTEDWPMFELVLVTDNDKKEGDIE